MFLSETSVTVKCCGHEVLGFQNLKYCKSKIDNGQTTILLTPLIVQNPETCRTAQPVVSRALGCVVVEVQPPLNSDRS